MPMRLKTLFLLFLLLMLPIVLYAQESAEEMMPEIELYRSPLGFNLPIIADWENVSTRNAADFFNEDYDAEILVTLVNESDVETGMNQILTANFDVELPDEPIFTSKINLADGTWTQLIYQVDNRTISAMGQIRNDKTYTLTFVEDQTDADIYMLIVRNPDEALETSPPNPVPGMLVAAETLAISLPDEPTRTELFELPSGDWTEYIYEGNGDKITVAGFVFGNATYVTIAVGDAVGIEDATNAFNTAFLGFFVTPENNEFLYLGLIATAAIMLILVGSLWLRHRNAQKDIELIEQLQADE